MVPRWKSSYNDPTITSKFTPVLVKVSAYLMQVCFVRERDDGSKYFEGE